MKNVKKFINIRNFSEYLTFEPTEKIYPKKRVYIKKTVDDILINTRFEGISNLINDKKMDLALNLAFESSLDILFSKNDNDSFMLYYLIGSIHKDLKNYEEMIGNYQLALNIYDRGNVKEKEKIGKMLEGIIEHSERIEDRAIIEKIMKGYVSADVLVRYINKFDNETAVEILSKQVYSKTDALAVVYYNLGNLTTNFDYNIKADRLFRENRGKYINYRILNNITLASNNNDRKYVHENMVLLQELPIKKYSDKMNMISMKLESLKILLYFTEDGKERFEYFKQIFNILITNNAFLYFNNNFLINQMFREMTPMILNSGNDFTQYSKQFLKIHFYFSNKIQENDIIIKDQLVLSQLLNEKVNLIQFKKYALKSLKLNFNDYDKILFYNNILLNIFLKTNCSKQRAYMKSLSKQILTKDLKLVEKVKNNLSAHYLFGINSIIFAEKKIDYLNVILNMVRLDKRYEKRLKAYVDKYIDRYLYHADILMCNDQYYSCYYNIVSAKLFILLTKYLAKPDITKEEILQGLNIDLPALKIKAEKTISDLNKI
jgi:hypothetical protein